RTSVANVMPEGEARTMYERYSIPGPGCLLVQLAFANLNPWAANRVNFCNPDRAPLLLVTASEDRLIPPSLVRCTLEKYAQSPAITAYKEFPQRSHLIIAQDGWREVASSVLAWAESWTTDKALDGQVRPVVGLSGDDGTARTRTGAELSRTV